MIFFRFVHEQHHFEVEIETGKDDGIESKFVYQCKPHINSNLGNLFLKIATEAHPRFEHRYDGVQWRFSGSGPRVRRPYGVHPRQRIWIPYRHPYLFQFQLLDGVPLEQTCKKKIINKL